MEYNLNLEGNLATKLNSGVEEAVLHLSGKSARETTYIQKEASMYVAN